MVSFLPIAGKSFVNRVALADFKECLGSYTVGPKVQCTIRTLQSKNSSGLLAPGDIYKSQSGI